MALPRWPMAAYLQPPHRREEPDHDGYERSDRTQLALILGIVSLLCGPLGILVWIVSHDCLRAIREGRMDPAGEANAKAGRLLGIISLAMFMVKVIGLILGIVLFDWKFPFVTT